MLHVNVLESKRTTMEHLTERLTAQFLSGQATRDEARVVVRHILTQCPHCATLARRILVRPPKRNQMSIFPSFPTLLGRETARTSPSFPESQAGEIPGHLDRCSAFFKSRAT
jgi:hypothetical protein